LVSASLFVLEWQKGGETGDRASVDGDVTEAEGSFERSIQEEEVLAP